MATYLNLLRELGNYNIHLRHNKADVNCMMYTVRALGIFGTHLRHNRSYLDSMMYIVLEKGKYT